MGSKRLDDALAIMDTDPEAKVIADFIRTLPTDFADFEHDKESFAVYNPYTKMIWINTQYPEEVEELASTLVHEGTHAMDYANGTAVIDGDVIPIETHAYEVTVRYWERRFPHGRHVTNSNNERSNNDWVDAMHNGTLKDTVAELYDPLSRFLRFYS